MADFTGDSSGINLSNPIVITTPSDGQPASVASSLGVGVVFQRIANFFKALVVRGDGHNTRLLTLEGLNLSTRVTSTESQIAGVRGKTDPAGGNALWHKGNLRIFQGVGYITPGTYINNLDMIFSVPGAQPGDFVIAKLQEAFLGNRVIVRGFVSNPNEVYVEIGIADSGSFQSGGGSSVLDNMQSLGGQVQVLVIGF